MSDYHQKTAYRRQAMGGHYLDWANQPRPFKRYKGLEPRPLPADPSWPGERGFWDLSLAEQPPGNEGELSWEQLAGVLLLAAGISAQSRASGISLRTWASAGGLYPAELYLATSGQPGLADGLHHFYAPAPGLQKLRSGPLARALADSLGQGPRRLFFLLSTIFWRSQWKYRSRCFRYCLLDCGHLLANLELALCAYGLAPATCLDFNDAALNRLAGLDDRQEAFLAAVGAGPRPAAPGESDPGPCPELTAEPLSPLPQSDPVVIEAYGQGRLTAASPPPVWPAPKPTAQASKLPRPQGGGPPLLEVLARRRSRRNFLDRALSPMELARLLAAALPAPGPCSATVILAQGGDLPQGVHRYLAGSGVLDPVAASHDPRRRMAAACLDQMWIGRAGLLLLLWARPQDLARAAGPRGYRHAMLAAGRAGQRLYLAATALGLGCCGVGAFYDQEVAHLAELPSGALPLYLLAAGPIKGGPGT